MAQTRSGLKPTVNDIARVAGVSLATVDRVLNARPGVRTITVDKVNKAISELGYVRDTAAANLARKRVYKLLFILPTGKNEFIRLLRTQIDEQIVKLAYERTRIDTILVPAFDPKAIVKTLDELEVGQVDGVAMFGPETQEVKEAIDRAKVKGISLVALVSDISGSSRDHFVGIDNMAAGRTAAQLMGRFVHGAGDILVITGSNLAHDHVKRRQGFESLLRNEYPHLNVVATIEGHDDGDRIKNMMPEILKNHPNLAGIYSAAAGNSGLIAYLDEVKEHKNITIIAHELTVHTRKALSSGTFDAVISQDTGHLVRSAIRLLKATADKAPIDHMQERIRLDIYLKENMPTL